MAKILIRKPEGSADWEVIEQPIWNATSSESLAAQILDRSTASYVEWTTKGTTYRVMEDSYANQA